MFYTYFDESKYQPKNFVIGSYVFCRENPASFISKTLLENGYDPNIDEYKSSVHFGRNPMMFQVRETLKEYFHENCYFGIVVTQHDDLKDLGFVALQALETFLRLNKFEPSNEIFFDEGIFQNTKKALNFALELGLGENTFHFEQDSKKIKGIQLADLCSHCLTTMLREALGDLSKMVRVPENSGYDSDTESEIGFEIWASIRYSFLRQADKTFIEDANQEINFTFDVEPYGLFIPNNCNEILAAKAREIFGAVFIGCIH